MKFKGVYSDDAVTKEQEFYLKLVEEDGGSNVTLKAVDKDGNYIGGGNLLFINKITMEITRASYVSRKFGFKLEGMLDKVKIS